MSAERRAQSRRVLTFKIRVDGPKGRLNVTARDLSAAGVFVETTTSYPRGQMLECRLELPEGDRPRRLELTAEVRHQTNDYHTEDGRGPYRGIGLRFVRMDAEVQAALTSFLTAESSG